MPKDKEQIKQQCKDIYLVNIKNLVPYKDNPNKHTDEQIDVLCRCIRYNGFRDPLVVQKGTGIIVSGEGRWLAAKKLGMEKVPVSYQEFDSEAQLYAHVNAANGVAKQSHIDYGQVNDKIGDLGPDFDLDVLGLPNFKIDVADKMENLDLDLDRKIKSSIVTCPSCQHRFDPDDKIKE